MHCCCYWFSLSEPPQDPAASGTKWLQLPFKRPADQSGLFQHLSLWTTPTSCLWPFAESRGLPETGRCSGGLALHSSRWLTLLLVNLGCKHTGKSYPEYTAPPPQMCPNISSLAKKNLWSTPKLIAVCTQVQTHSDQTKQMQFRWHCRMDTCACFYFT